MRQYFYSLISGERKDWVVALARVVLIPLSWGYGVGVRWMRCGYESGIFAQKKVNIPVISIGNLTMGGSGKTPMAVFLANMLRTRRRKPAIIVRGYKPGIFQKIEGIADEQMMMAKALKDVVIVANPDRYAAAKEAVEEDQADVVILDDGFQHWKLKRDLDIVLVDCTNPFGNGSLIPAGILREPVSSLRKADIIVLTKTDKGKVYEIRRQIEMHYPTALVVETVHMPESLTDIYTGKNHGLYRLNTAVVVFCGIGDPLSFKSTVLSLGADVKEFFPFMDHHAYELKDMQKIKDACVTIGIRTIVTTGKDAVKLEPFREFWNGFQIYSLNIEIEMTKGEKEFISGIEHVLDR